MRAIIVKQPGPAEVMKLHGGEDPGPPPGQISVRVLASGVNFIDVYHRNGQYPLPTPFTPGLEGAGTVAAVGEGVDEFQPGDQVSWSNVPGSYADLVIGEAGKFVSVPDRVAPETAAAVMLQGLTAHYLCNDVYQVGEGDTVLIHAAAGGVGLLLTQMVKLKGGRVIGTAGSDSKADLARSNGCDEVIGYQDFTSRVRELTDEEGVSAVFDGVGRATFDGSLDSLRPRGTMALFGQASGAVPPVDPQRLNSAGSVCLWRPNLADFISTAEEYRRRAGELFDMISHNDLVVRVNHRYSLKEAAQAHKDLEQRKTTGKAILIP
ncbi:quinone oxidoreductase family protein [Haloglycomyces albus]|uniref:quinone oxidoreductase family protein n=1 Tax=Haloglycomyces albus TaxID=526067 RepID=UPI00046D2AC1|nr:quinone oxidoreductase [Haloglycomyces albus]